MPAPPSRKTRVRGTHAAALLLAVLSGQPVAGGVVEAQLRDAQGAALADAVVTVEPLGQRSLEAEPGRPALARIAQRGHRFVPFVLPVHTGTAVEFPNYDETRHHVYSFSEAKTFEIKLYRGDPERAIHFDRAGVVVLGCNIHDYMQGFVYVTDAPYFARSGAEGRIRIDDLPAGRYRVTAWHPWQRDARSPREVEVPEGTATTVSLHFELTLQPPPPGRPEENALRSWVHERQGTDG